MRKTQMIPSHAHQVSVPSCAKRPGQLEVNILSDARAIEYQKAQRRQLPRASLKFANSEHTYLPTDRAVMELVDSSLSRREVPSVPKANKSSLRDDADTIAQAFRFFHVVSRENYRGAICDGASNYSPDGQSR